MSKVFDFFTKKQIDVVENEVDYITRIQNCLNKIVETNKPCNCKYCNAKSLLANKLMTISEWLILDHQQKTGLRFAKGDWADIITETQYYVDSKIYKVDNEKV